MFPPLSFQAMLLLADSWVWRPVMSPLHITAVALVVFALAIAAYVRSPVQRASLRTGLLLMRLALVGAVATLMMGPSAMPPVKEETRRPRLAVLLDTSESMQTTDCQGRSRFEFAASDWLSEERLAELSNAFDVDLRGFDTQSRSLARSGLRLSAEKIADGRATHLADSVHQTVSNIRAGEEGESILLISDGHDSEEAPVQPAASLAKSKGVPIHTVAVGGADKQVDVALLAVPMQDYLLPGEPGGILVKVYQSGLDDATASVRLRRGGEERIVPIAFEGRNMVEAKLPVRHEERGQFEYTVEVDKLPGEFESANNSQQVFVDVQEKRLRVLALEGQPFWDSKFLAQSLRKDNRLELTQITQVSRAKRETIVTRSQSGGVSLPESPQRWAEYDVVILGKSMENLLTPEAASQLSDFVSQGGHLILSRGQPCSPDSAGGEAVTKMLKDVTPVDWRNQRRPDVKISLTASGRASQWFAPTKMGVNVDEALARLPALAAMSDVESIKPGAIVLAEAAAHQGAENAAPAILSMNYGRGTVVAILGEGLWRWSLLSPDQQALAGFYDTFWSNLVRWLVAGGDFQPGDQVGLQLSRASSRLGDEVSVDVTYKALTGAAINHRLELTDPSGQTSELALTRMPGAAPRFRAVVKTEQTGVHRVKLTAPGVTPSELNRKFNVYDLNVERLETEVRPMPLRILAEHTGGRFFSADEAGELAGHLRRHRAASLVPPKMEYLWDKGVILALLLIWAGCEWILRRLAGLL